MSATPTQLCFSVSRYLLDIYLQKRTGERSTSFLDGSFGNGKQKGLIVNPLQVMATGTAERDVAAKLLSELPRKHRKTVGADKNYDTSGFVKDCGEMKIPPHVARNDKRNGGSAIDGRTSSKAGYKVSQIVRKRVEDPLGGVKQWG